MNSRPLIHRLGEFAPHAELMLDVPSRLADRLASGDLDVALIPSVEALQHPDYTIVSDACIACRGPVLSVKLLSRVPLGEIRSLALDAGSRTSVALVQILLRERYRVSPQLCPLGLEESLSSMSGRVDAILVIGDRAIRADRFPYGEHWDLGQQWCRWTGLPFVFAMWTARRGFDVTQIEGALRAARNAGLAALEGIAAASAAEVGLSTPACLSYLRDNLHFTLGKRERAGLQLFRRYAALHGFVSPEQASATLGSVQS